MHAHATDKSRAEKGTVDLKDTGSNDTCHLVIFNLAFGRSEWSAPITDASLVEQHNSCSLLLSVMGTGLLSHGEDGSHHTQNGETCGLSPSDERMRYDEWRERVKPWVRTLFEELIEIGK